VGGCVRQGNDREPVKLEAILMRDAANSEIAGGAGDFLPRLEGSLSILGIIHPVQLVKRVSNEDGVRLGGYGPVSRVRGGKMVRVARALLNDFEPSVRGEVKDSGDGGFLELEKRNLGGVSAQVRSQEQRRHCCVWGNCCCHCCNPMIYGYLLEQRVTILE